MFNRRRVLLIAASVSLAGFLCAILLLSGESSRQAVVASFDHQRKVEASAPAQYVVMAWNDLGMHCYNRDFTDLAVLPPYNTLWAQVIKVGDPPEVVTSGLQVEYSFADNTYSVGKSNFWDTSAYRPEQNAQWLFGLDNPLASNIGLTGNGLSGEMAVHSDHFSAEGIPLTEFSDTLPNTPAPFQLATIIVRETTSGAELARTNPVAPVSTEMHCDFCHTDNGIGNEAISTGKVESNILTKHDQEHMEDYPAQYSGSLLNHRPVLCAWCHATNALGATGEPGIPNLSQAMHHKHWEEGVQSNLAGCYSCHPGPRTQCLRGVMATQFGMECQDCHGDLLTVSQNPSPWLQEPRCDNVACHGSDYAMNHPLYRMSSGHGGLYCEACHDSPHAIAPSREANDAIKFNGWQDHNGPVDECIVCHASWPSAAGPHGISAPTVTSFTFEPDWIYAAEPGSTVVYTHTLHNVGNTADTYSLIWNSSQSWANVTPEFIPLNLAGGQSALVTVTVAIPPGEGVRGLIDTTILTVTSSISSSLVESVTDQTLVPVVRLYIPLVIR